MTDPARQHPDTVVAALVADLAAQWEDGGAQAGVLLQLASQGTSPGEARGLTSAHYHALYTVARQLCDAGRFEDALPICRQLALHCPADARYAFLAGTCLQRTGVHDQAVCMFALALLADANHAAAMFRFGECLQAIGDGGNAAFAFEATLELSRTARDGHRLHALASARLQRQRAPITA